MQQLRDEARAMFFEPLPSQMVSQWSPIHVRVSGDAAAAVPAIRSTLVSLDPALPFVVIKQLSDDRTPELAPWRITALVTGVFGALALVLAVIGLYGVIAFLTEQRTRELGMRIALGADGPAIARLVLGEGVRVTATGCAAGAFAAFALARLIRARLYGVSPAEPATYAVVVLVLGTAALLACWIPARRAARIDPIEALRAD